VGTDGRVNRRVVAGAVSPRQPPLLSLATTDPRGGAWFTAGTGAGEYGRISPSGDIDVSPGLGGERVLRMAAPVDGSLWLVTMKLGYSVQTCTVRHVPPDGGQVVLIMPSSEGPQDIYRGPISTGRDGAARIITGDHVVIIGADNQIRASIGIPHVDGDAGWIDAADDSGTGTWLLVRHQDTPGGEDFTPVLLHLRADGSAQRYSATDESSTPKLPGQVEHIATGRDGRVWLETASAVYVLTGAS
jgi:hypothetical protein